MTLSVANLVLTGFRFLYLYIISSEDFEMKEKFLTEINENLKIYQLKDGLTFTTDAYLLYAYMKKRPNSVAVDFGSGTGVISLLCAVKNKYKTIYAAEIQKDFCDLIQENVVYNKLENKVIPCHCDISEISADYFASQVDVVFSNPPYMKDNSGKSNLFDEKNIARHEIHGTIYDFCASAGKILKHGGYFYAVYRPERLCELLCGLRDANIEPKRITFVHARENLPPSLVLLEAKKGANPSVFVTKPLIMYKNGTEYTDDLKYIYENGEFNEQYKKS